MPLDQPSAIADAKGEFRLDTQADGQPIPLHQSVTFQVRLVDRREFDASVVPTGSAAVTIKLPTLRSGGPKGPEQFGPDELTGVVVDAQGRPLEGGLIQAHSWVPNYKALTDEEGRFRDKVHEQGKIEIRLGKADYEPRQFLGQPTGQPGWVVVMGDRTYFESRVPAHDGSPMADASIRADRGMQWMDGGIMIGCWTGGRSGRDGRYRLCVEPGMTSSRSACRASAWRGCPVRPSRPTRPGPWTSSSTRGRISRPAWSTPGTASRSPASP